MLARRSGSAMLFARCFGGHSLQRMPSGQAARITFVGAGKMAEAIVNGLLPAPDAAGSILNAKPVTTSDDAASDAAASSGRPDVTVADLNDSRLDVFRDRWPEVTATTDSLDAVSAADIVVFAVKPQNSETVFRQLHGAIKPETLCISIMAGVPCRDIQTGLGCRRVVRTMPNTPAAVRESMTVWYATDEVTESEDLLKVTRQVLRSFGQEEQVRER